MSPQVCLTRFVCFASLLIFIAMMRTQANLVHFISDWASLCAWLSGWGARGRSVRWWVSTVLRRWVWLVEAFKWAWGGCVASCLCLCIWGIVVYENIVHLAGFPGAYEPWWWLRFKVPSCASPFSCGCQLLDRVMILSTGIFPSRRRSGKKSFASIPHRAHRSSMNVPHTSVHNMVHDQSIHPYTRNPVASLNAPSIIAPSPTRWKKPSAGLNSVTYPSLHTLT